PSRLWTGLWTFPGKTRGQELCRLWKKLRRGTSRGPLGDLGTTRALDLPAAGTAISHPSRLRQDMPMASDAHHHHHHHCHGPDEPAAALARDPVCGMSVNPATAKWRLERQGEQHYFCSQKCRDRFAADPLKYSEAREKHLPRATSATGSLWTCPMHPEILRAGPGSCPLCGMALEPLDGGGTGEANPELRDMTRRFWVSLILSLPLFFVAMAEDMAPHGLAPPVLLRWAELALATPVVLWGGLPFFARGWQSLVNRSLNMFTLIALGTGVAYVYSLAATLFPGAFPPSFRGMDGGVAVYFEAAAVITTLVLLGQVLELRARATTGGAIRALLDLAPATARRLNEDDSEDDIPLAAVSPGDRLRVRPGEKVPVDGVVVAVSGTIDEAMLTGEAMPVEKAPGDKVTGATLNRSGSLIIRAEHVGADTLLARIVAMVAAAQRSRAPIQRLADRVSGWFVPAVIIVAVITFIAWALYGPPPAMAFALLNAVAVLLIACPCALGLAPPVSIMVGTGRAAGAGILVRNAEALEGMEKIDTLVLDKTGTLTLGKPRLVRIEAAGGIGEDEMLRLLAGLERGSEHPLAAAIIDAAESRGVARESAAEFHAHAGKGVVGVVAGRRVALGNVALLAELGIDDRTLTGTADAARHQGETVMFAAIDGKLAGLVAVADPIKETARAALDALRGEGLRIVMLTGDNRATAEAVAG